MSTALLLMIYIFGVGFFVGQLRHIKDGTPGDVAVGVVVGLAWPLLLLVSAVIRVTLPPKVRHRG